MWRERSANNLIAAIGEVSNHFNLLSTFTYVKFCTMNEKSF